MLMRWSSNIHRPLSHLAVPRLKTMQNAATPTSSPIVRASSTKWKRARPVSAQYSSTKLLNVTPTSRPSLPLGQFTEIMDQCAQDAQGQPHVSSNTQSIKAFDNLASGVSIDEALQRMQLNDRPPTLRLQPSPRMAAQHTATAYTDAGSMPEHVAHLERSYQSETCLSSENSGEESGTHDSEVFRTHAKDDTISVESYNVESSSDSEYLSSQDVESSAMEEVKTQEEDQKEEEEDETEAEAEEHIDLTYQIPEDTLRTAMLASENTRASFWSTKMYRGPDGQSIAIHYCRTKDVAERVAQYFLKEKVVGFDIEWKPWASPLDLKKNASLIQLACEDRIALFHISQFVGTTSQELMPPTLKAILETPDIYKVGVAVKGDFSRLEKFLNIQPQGVFELSRLHNLVELHATDPTKLSNKLVSLANQVLQHLQLPLYKGAPLADDPKDKESVRESDWSKPLDMQQIHYAAADAYAGFRLYHILEWKRKQLRPTPPTRGLCDYDSKRDPRPKAPKKKATAKSKKASKDAAEQSTVAVELDNETDQQVEQDNVAEAQDTDEGEEELGYSTAPEEFTDSSEEEVSPPRPAMDSGLSAPTSGRPHKRIGRVNLAWLRGPDPEYPVLPQASDDENEETASCHEDDSAVHAKAGDDAVSSSDIHLPTSELVEVDEFADPDLEEALQVLDLDDDGKLRETDDSAVIVDGMEVDAGAESANESATLTITSSTNIEVNDDIPSDTEVDQATTSSPSNTETAPAPTTDALHTPEYNLATTWAQSYLHSTIPSPSSTTPSRIRATIPHLRAYHLWHVQELSLDEIAGHLRDPPLSHNTVTGYILQAVSFERLEYETDAMRDIMMNMPKGLKMGRWKWMAEKVGALK